MSFFWKTMGGPDVPKGVNMQFTSFGKKAEKEKEGYSNQKVNNVNMPDQKNRSNITKNGRPGAGWEDDDGEPNQNQFKKENKNINNKQTVKPNKTENTFYSEEELIEQQIDYELKLVGDMVAPSGLRVKPVDSLLISFGRACESLNTEVIGSILLNNLKLDFSNQMIMKCLYCIEFLIKNQKKYNSFFLANQRFLEDIAIFPEESQNSQINSLKTQILNILENKQPNEQKQIQPDALLLKSLSNNNFKLENESQPPNSNNLLDLVNESPESLIQMNIKNEEPLKQQTGFSFINKEKNNKSQQNNSVPVIKKKFDPFSIPASQPKDNTETNMTNQFGESEKEKNNKKTLDFIKNNKKNNVISNSNEIPKLSEEPKKKFDFIKNNSNPNSNPINSSQISQLTDDLISLKFEENIQNNQHSKQEIKLPYNISTNNNITNNNINNSQKISSPVNPMIINSMNKPNNQPFSSNLNNLYMNYPQTNLNPMMINFMYAQMSQNYNPMAMGGYQNINYPYGQGIPGYSVPHNDIGGFDQGINSFQMEKMESEKTKIKEPEKKKVIDESAFDFIKIE